MASFAPKRKARIIQTLDDEDTELPSPPMLEDATKKDGEFFPADTRSALWPSLLIQTQRASKLMDTLPIVPAPQGPIKFGRSKPAKSSSLRKSINFNEDDTNRDDHTLASPLPGRGADRADDTEEQTSGPIVIRPALSRSSSTKQKKRQSTASRLSFGPDDGVTRNGDEPSPEVVTPKKTLGQRALQNNALRKSASFQSLGNMPGRFGSEEERPRYSKEYLEELQSSTPNTPHNVSSLLMDDSDAMELDPSELEGALVVQSQDLSALTAQPSRPPAAASILTDMEIRQRKEQRARLAKESEFISLEGETDEEESSRVTLRINKKKTESRLIAEDEDLGEGYEEFVSDGGLALGRKAEREAEQRHRQEMADLIKAAEDGSDAESDDSEAERRAAYEAAQRRAGMDGLHRHDDDDADMEDGGIGSIPRMKPLPDVNEVMERMRNLVKGLENEMTLKRSRIADLEKEKVEILAREEEVQEILNQAGAKYQALVGNSAGLATADAPRLMTQSPLRPLPPGIGAEFPVERGLESFGTTPTKRPDTEIA